MSVKRCKQVDLRELTADELALLIAEEGAEVAHAATKVLRFGSCGRWPDEPSSPTNDEALLDEFWQLYHIIRIYGSKRGYNHGVEMEKRPERKVYTLVFDHWADQHAIEDERHKAGK